MSSRIETWLELQGKTWEADAGTCAAVITLERQTGEKVGEWPVKLEGLAEQVTALISLQQDELPKGSFPYRLVSYNDKREQMSELPQTLRGRNQEAGQVQDAALSLQKSVTQLLQSWEATRSMLSEELTSAHTRATEANENVAELLEKLVETKGTNFVQELDLQRFIRNQARLDMLIEQFAPVAAMAGEMALKRWGRQFERLLKESLTENDGPEDTDRPTDNPDDSRSTGDACSGDKARSTGNSRSLTRRTGPKTTV